MALFKKEIPSKYLNVINGIGFALLMALMLFVTFHDIVKRPVRRDLMSKQIIAGGVAIRRRRAGHDPVDVQHAH